MGVIISIVQDKINYYEGLLVKSHITSKYMFISQYTPITLESCCIIS